MKHLPIGSEMKQFIARYVLYLGILFLLFYSDLSPLAGWINSVQTQLTLSALDFFLEPGQLQGIDILITSNYKIIINQACNGMIPILFLSASILAYPAKWYQKVLWILIGYLSFVAVNIFRIMVVVHFALLAEGGRNFYWSHDLLGNALLMFTGLSIFVLFIKMSRS